MMACLSFVALTAACSHSMNFTAVPHEVSVRDINSSWVSFQLVG